MRALIGVSGAQKRPSHCWPARTFRSAYLSCFFLVAVSFATSIQLHADPAFPGLPERWARYNHLDWDFNNYTRGVLPKRERTIRKVYQFKIQPGMTVTKSRSFSSRNLSQMMADGIGFIVDDGSPAIQTLVLNGTLTPAGESAAKIQSWSTYEIWHSDANDGKEWDVFFIKEGWGGARAIVLTDYLNQAMAKIGETNFTVIAEPLKIEGNLGGILPIDQTYRMAIGVDSNSHCPEEG
jgi:hypothetical protein